MANNNHRDNDYFWAILGFTLVVAISLVAISFIPPLNISHWHMKRTNILSSFMYYDDLTVSNKTSADIIDVSSMKDQPDQVMQAVDSMSTGIDADGSLALDDVDGAEESNDINAVEIDNGIEDYSHNGMMSRRFIDALTLESQKRNVRIAFLGDSFIESDILTSSFRQIMQQTYGGEGAGFIPFADPVGKWRPTIEQRYANWTCYNLLRKKRAPEIYKNDFYVSGYVSVPQPNASAVFNSRVLNKKIQAANCARIIFKNRANGVMNVVVNKQDTLHYNLPISDKVQCIDIKKSTISNLSVTLPQCNDFIGYGVVFQGDKGVNIDNYGLRSNSGISLFSTEMEVNKQIGAMMNYDLIVLEYGLNAMQKTVTNYNFYAEKLERLVNFIHLCFPQSAIMMISVGDVGMKVNDQIVTAPAVCPMVEAQRSVAKKCHVIFWNLFHEMGGEGSMKRFVSNGWAGKDYLHINMRGGNQVASLLVNSINKKKEETKSATIYEKSDVK